MQKGFTLIELMVTVGIFVFMTGLLIARYTSFDQGVLLTNLAYDVALNIRSAQAYGLNVRNSSGYGGNYSVVFNTSNTTAQKSFTLNAGGSPISTTNITRGSMISTASCVGSGPGSCTPTSNITVSFTRPDPSASINGGNAYGEIIVQSASGSTKKVIVRSTGQIYVSN